MMIQLGTIKKCKEIGLKGGNSVVYHACEICGKQRWVTLRKGKPKNWRCLSCSHKDPIKRAKHSKFMKTRRGEKSNGWKGGKYKTKEGYVFILLQPEDFFYSMANQDGYVFEHRLTMAKHLKRCLQREEIIHHKNGIKGDNRLENLELTTLGQHSVDHSKGYVDGYNKGLEDGMNKQIKELKKIIKSLEAGR